VANWTCTLTEGLANTGTSVIQHLGSNESVANGADQEITVTPMHERTSGMSPLQMIEEWDKGCSVAGPASAGIGNPGYLERPEECVECTEGLVEALRKVLTDALPRLRELRLWHWQQAMECRAKGKMAREARTPMPSFDDRANQHIKFVQTLNDFFPMGDNAERDAENSCGHGV
jgi:hypothetical protein